MTRLENERSVATSGRGVGAARPPSEPAATTDVLRALEALPERQREVIRLKFQGGLSYREIGAVWGLSVSNVGFLIHTGLKALRGQLNPVDLGAHQGDHDDD